MKYRLISDRADGKEPVVSDDLDGDFRAAEWARTWLQQNADHDFYNLEREDGASSILMVRTVAGQWYSIPRVAVNSKAEKRAQC